jgi:protein TonB
MTFFSVSTYSFNESKNSYFKFALALAIGVHGLLILGIQFSELTAPTKSPAWSLNVSFLKPAGGQQDTTTHTAPPKVSGPQKPALPPVPETAPRKSLHDTAKLITTPTPATALPSEYEQPPSATPAKAPAKPTPTSSGSALTTLSVADLLDQGVRQARLSADQDRLGNAREKHADLYNTTTPDGAYAAYWVEKVERVGELNLPRTLRQSKGKAPILDVAIRADGSLGDILIIRSSGNKQLDATIRRIVTEAAPYAPFPDTLRRQYDVLRIKHQWTFR